MHKVNRERVITGTGSKDKTPVMDMIERGGNIRAFVVDGRRKKELQEQVRDHVEAGAGIFTGELKSHNGLESDCRHSVINQLSNMSTGTFTRTRWKTSGGS
jgi:hypothetical protein